MELFLIGVSFAIALSVVEVQLPAPSRSILNLLLVAGTALLLRCLCLSIVSSAWHFAEADLGAVHGVAMMESWLHRAREEPYV